MKVNHNAILYSHSPTGAVCRSCTARPLAPVYRDRPLLAASQQSDDGGGPVPAHLASVPHTRLQAKAESRPQQGPGHSRVQATARSRPQQATGTKQGQGTQQAPGHSRVQASAGSSLTARSRPDQGPGRSSPCVPVFGDAGRHPVAGGGAG